MTTYQYRGFDARGAVARGLIEGGSAREARERLAAQGVLAERLTPTRARRGLPAGARAVVYRELASLLRSGVPLANALEILMASPDNRAVQVMLAGTRDGVREGLGLAEALARAAGTLTGFERAVIEAAERSAAMDTLLERLADFLDQQEGVRRRVQTALMYPTLVVGVGLVVAVVMLGLLVPRAARLLAGGDARLPGLTRGMLGVGGFVQAWWPALVVGGAAAAAGLTAWWRRAPALRRWVDRRVLEAPLLGAPYRLLCGLRFARTLAILLDGGVSPIDGMILAGRATGSPWVRGLSEQEAEAVRHGSRLSEAVSRIPPLAEALPGWIQVGEAGGELVRLLDGAGERLEMRWDRMVHSILALLEPVLLLLIGAFVLLVTLSVMLPILELSRSLGQ